MAGNFDPYWEWLKIPLSEQPPNHYRLLRLTPFESDPQIIESAVNHLVERMHKLSQGNQVAHAQKILNNVAKANLCLSDPQKKLEYDTQLKTLRQQAPHGNGNSNLSPAQSQRNSTPDERSSQPGKGNTASRKATETLSETGLTFEEAKRVKLMTILASLMALAGAVSGVLLVWLLSPAQSESPAVKEKGSPNQGTQASDKLQSQPDEKIAFSQIANEVAKKLEHESEVARQEDKKETEKESHPENKNNISADLISDPPPSAPASSPSPPNNTAVSTPAESQPTNPAANAAVVASEGLKRVGSNGDAYAPDKQTLFESLIKKEIFLEGTVLDVESSKSGKTHYLTFGRRQEVIFVMAGAADVALDKLSPLKGQHVRVRGIVEKEYERLGLRIKKFDQIQIQPK